MSNISSWSTTAASNNSAAPNGAPEGMAPSGVNDCIRENMSAVAKFYKDSQGALTTTGSSNAYVLTTNSSHASLAAMGLTAFIANHTNSGAATLAVDGLTAKNIYYNGAALGSGTIVDGNTYIVTYNATGDVYDLVSTANVDLSDFSAPIRSARTSNTLLGVSDIGKVIDITSGTFSQTFAAAATLGAGWFVWLKNTGTGTITLDPNASETIDGAATKVATQDAIYMIFCDGSNLFTLSASAANIDHHVCVTTGNGHGSTNTKIRRFSATKSSSGSAITYADSATLGATFTINHTGLYSIAYQDAGPSDVDKGVSVNSSQLTTDIQSITAADIVVYHLQAGGFSDPVTVIARLSAGDVIRPHTDGTPNSTSALRSAFRITKIAS